jgi:hypothetical protein
MRELWTREEEHHPTLVIKKKEPRNKRAHLAARLRKCQVNREEERKKVISHWNVSKS